MKHDIRLVSGQPDDTELAALVAVLLTLAEREPPDERATPPDRASWPVVQWSGRGGEYRAPNSWR